MKTRTGAARGAAPRRATALAAALVLLIAVPAHAHAPRVAELVSPADNTGDMGQLGLLTADGEHAGYTSSGAFSGGPQTGAPITYLAARTAVGWATTPVLTPSPTAVRAIADSGNGVVWQSADPADPDDTSTNSTDLFFRDGAGPLTRISSGSLNTHGVPVTFAAANATLSSVFFESAAALEPPDGTRTGPSGLYEWRSGTLANIAVPDAAAAKGGAVLGGGLQRTRTGALSADGSRIVLTSPAVTAAGNRLRLWVRDTPNGPIAPLIATAPTQDQFFDGASADGSIVLLSTKEALNSGDTDGTQSDLWSVQVATGAIARVSTGGDASTCTAPKLTGCEARAVAISADGSTVAFVSGESLATGATANAPNLYVHSGTTTRFIATLASTDAALNVAPPGSETRISADGSRLFFLSAAKLTPDDTDASPDLYSADTATGALTLLSQGPAGGNAAAAPVLLSSAKPGYVPTSQQVVAPRAISDDGHCAFFETVEGLVAEDTNGQQDVYENCDGVTALLSAGTGTAPSHLINNSADGRDVLIVTTDVLSPDDRDGGASLYDLRAGGRAAPTPPIGCSGDACQGAPTSPSERPAVASFGAVSAASSSGVPGALLIVRQPSLAARKTATKRGQIEVVADMPGAGQFDVTVKARMKGKMKTVAHGKATSTKAGTVRLRIALPKSVRTALRRKEIFFRVTGHFVGAGVDTTDVASYVLPRRRSGK